MKHLDIIIADDHLIVAKGIAALLPSGAQCVAIASTLGQTEQLLRQHRPDILLLDIALPDGDGIDAIPYLHRASPATRIIMLTMYAEGAVIRRALDAHVNGYLLKGAGIEELARAIHTVAKGETFLCKEARIMVAGHKSIPPLTPREHEILLLIVNGLSIKEISEHLCLGFETIHSYTKNLRHKLGCSNTATLVRTAIERHLV